MTQFFQLPTSFSLTTDNKLMIYIHVPLRLSSTTLTLYEYLSLPIHLFQNNSYYYQILPQTTDIPHPSFNLSTILLLNPEDVENAKIQDALIHMTKPIQITDTI